MAYDPEYMRAYYQANKERIKENTKRSKLRDPLRYKALNKKSRSKTREEQPERILELERRWREKNPTAYLLTHARARAKKQGLEFSLTPEDVVVPEACPALGIPLFWGTGRRASLNHNSPSLDRLDPSKGYVSGNVRVISNRANHLKNNATATEMRLIADYIDRELGPR